MILHVIVTLKILKRFYKTQFMIRSNLMRNIKFIILESLSIINFKTIKLENRDFGL